MERDRLRRLARARAVARFIARDPEGFEEILADELDLAGIPRLEMVDADLAREEVDRLTRLHGSIAAAGRAYADRYGLKPESGARTLRKVRNGCREVSFWLYDRLTML